MRYVSFLLSFLVVGATTAFGSPAAQLYQRATGFDLDADLAIRNDGDASVFYGRTPTFEEIRARDTRLQDFLHELHSCGTEGLFVTSQHRLTALR